MLLTAAERILKGIRHRADRCKSVDEINGYFAGDAMPEKVRDLVRQLLELGDSVKAEPRSQRLRMCADGSIVARFQRAKQCAGIRAALLSDQTLDEKKARVSRMAQRIEAREHRDAIGARERSSRHEHAAALEV